MVYDDNFVDANLRALNVLVGMTSGTSLHVILGYVDRNTTGRGKPFHNKAAIIHDGAIVGNYRKQLLPF